MTPTEDVTYHAPRLDRLPDARLQRMLRAGAEVEECYRVLAKGGLNIVGEILRGEGTFYEMEHYPRDDVYDSDTHAQYYYHAHRTDAPEHGHFHTFVRAAGMPADMAPTPYDGEEPRPLGEEAICHLIAISMDEFGFPRGLFAVNRWVTAESWYSAADTTRLLDRFAIDHAAPSWPVNRWIGAMIRLFQPQIAALLDQRDRVVAQWTAKHPDSDVYEDRALDITGDLPIDVAAQIAEVRDILAARNVIDIPGTAPAPTGEKHEEVI